MFGNGRSYADQAISLRQCDVVLKIAFESVANSTTSFLETILPQEGLLDNRESSL